ncbi:hypothetical protein EG327_001510 [Venturia inaequalis]|uniref:Major facilitator superfamily (MFS) profile domain-containing protein n=1 Tax=Venturia inaequalis TaxID=5025 RepID=A0A8H3ZEJ2_VENIN|nr:hypothetical protein EG327_001510 [Venturia inaequalis]
MLKLLSPLRTRNSQAHPDVVIPMKSVRHPDRGGSDANRGADRPTGDGQDGDFEPLLQPDGESDIERLRYEIDRDLSASGGDSSYDRKSKVINKAIQDIGMGRYQWELFMLCGMGWLADNLWMQGLALVLPQLSAEFGVSSSKVKTTTLVTFIGLSIGSTFWGVASDIIGRRIAFNATLLICGVFGALVAAGPSWIVTALLFGCMGLGVGGNLPVDGALFLEFIPATSQNLLTLLSVWWPVGQLLASVMAWVLIPPFSCDTALAACSLTNHAQPCCNSRDNRGWRYFIAALGVLTLFMFACRFFLFHLFESPKFLLSRGREEEAVSVIQSIAYHNGAKTWLTMAVLEELAEDAIDDGRPRLTVLEINKRNLSKFSLQKVESLFIDWKLGITTGLLWFIWATIGMGYPLFNAFLPQYLEHVGQGQTPVSAGVVYRNFLITSIVGVPGSIIACYTVDLKWIGRKGTMAISTLVSGIFLYLFTLSSSPPYQTFCSSIEAFFQNIMYGVLYAYTPEVFPAPSRGTGTGIASLLNRIAGFFAPVVAARFGELHPSAPILAAGACYIAAFVAMCLLPIETRGRQSL